MVRLPLLGRARVQSARPGLADWERPAVLPELPDATEARTMTDLPPDHVFPDGDSVHYWRDESGIIWGILMNKKFKPKGPKFKFHGSRRGKNEAPSTP